MDGVGPRRKKEDGGRRRVVTYMREGTVDGVGLVALAEAGGGGARVGGVGRPTQAQYRLSAEGRGGGEERSWDGWVYKLNSDDCYRFVIHIAVV